MKPINQLILLILCGALFGVQANAQKTPAKPGDARVVKALNQTKTKYEFSDDNYLVAYELPGKRLQKVFIMSGAEKVYGLEVRGVFSYAMIGDAPPSNLLLELLEQNIEKISSWAVQKMDDGKFVIVNIAFIPADADGKRLEAAMLSVAEAADAMEARLSKKDEL